MRYQSILGEGLQVGLETTVLRNAVKGVTLPPGFAVRDPNARGDKPEALTVSLIHPAEDNNVNLDAELLSPLTEDSPFLTIVFAGLPDELPKIFQRLNFMQVTGQGYLGMVCGRFGEEKPFIIRQKTQNPEAPVGHVNLDFLSKTSTWNPLFVKYRLKTGNPEREIGYLVIKAGLDETRKPRAVVSRVPETQVPEFLKTAQTFPQ